MIKAAILAALILAGTPWSKKPAPEPVTATPPSVEIVEAVEPEEPEEPEWTHSAVCTITHFCNYARCCGKWAGSPTASGAWPEAGRTVAVDPSVIPLGSEVLINGHVYIAEDTGVSGYWVDIYCDNHQEALNRGMYTTEVSWR